MSPRAVERLESYKPAWPLPKIFRLTKGGKLNEGIFEGETINTPSMLCVEDYLDALEWAKSIGGLAGTVARSDANAKAIADWVARTPWIAHLADDPAIRSNTSVCLKVVDPAVTRLSADAQAAFAKALAARSRRKASPTTSPITATRRPACASGAARPSRRATSRRLRLARLGLRASQSRAAEGGVTH